VSEERYPPLSDYGLIGDCHSAAFVSRWGSIDWFCMPRFASGSSFGRLVDWDAGGFCSIRPTEEDNAPAQDYVDETLVLETRFRTEGGEARLLDCFTIDPQRGRHAERHLLRVVEGVRGVCELEARIAPRFDYGELRPWIRKHGLRVFSATGGDDGLLIAGDLDLEPGDDHDLFARFRVRGGERARLSIRYAYPEDMDTEPPVDEPAQLDRMLERTVAWWRGWVRRLQHEAPHDPGVLRSALALKALSYAPTGAIAAAATASLPGALDGDRNWDYRYSWVRDSTLSVRSLAELGYDDEADAFRRFIERSAGGNADDLQIVYGVGGERRLQVQSLSNLEGYRGIGPVRIGNEASRQRQLDAFGEIVNLTWRWHRRGHSPDDDYWRFLVDRVESAISLWEEPDCGLWEWRGEPRHFVHSKAMCWVAVDRGIRLSEECMRTAPVRKWTAARNEIRAAIESRGFDERRGAFLQAFHHEDLDAAVLMLPAVGFLEWEDERMVSTVDAVMTDLSDDGLLRRYSSDDGLQGHEGAFIACTFWLAECLARQDRLDEAERTFDAAISKANHLGLMSEQFDTGANAMIGNFPQAFSHYSHITAALAIAEKRSGGPPNL